MENCPRVPTWIYLSPNRNCAYLLRRGGEGINDVKADRSNGSTVSRKLLLLSAIVLGFRPPPRFIGASPPPSPSHRSSFAERRSFPSRCGDPLGIEKLVVTDISFSPGFLTSSPALARSSLRRSERFFFIIILSSFLLELIARPD